jgi:hypothetical protein
VTVENQTEEELDDVRMVHADHTISTTTTTT